jgi:hypothetical protein
VVKNKKSANIFSHKLRFCNRKLKEFPVGLNKKEPQETENINEDYPYGGFTS